MYTVDLGSAHWTSWSGHTIVHIPNCTSIDNQSIVFNATIIVYCSVTYYYVVINDKHNHNQGSLILPHSIIVNANNLSLWNWWQNRWKTSSSKNTKYTNFQIFFINQLLLCHFLPQVIFLIELVTSLPFYYISPPF